MEGSIRRLPFVPSVGGLATLDATLWHFSDLALMVGSVGLLVPGGSYDAAPAFNLGTGGYQVLYQPEAAGDYHL